MLTLAISSQVDVGYNSIGKEQALNLVGIFKQKDQMKSVGLAACNLDVDGAKAVADYVSVSASLTTVWSPGYKLSPTFLPSVRAPIVWRFVPVLCTVEPRQQSALRC